MPDAVVFEGDHQRRLLLRRVVGSISVAEVRAECLRYFRANPSTLKYDIINDHLGFRGKIDWDIVVELFRSVAELREAQPPPGGGVARKTLSAVVSKDPMMKTHLRAIEVRARATANSAFSGRLPKRKAGWIDRAPKVTGQKVEHK